MKKLIVLTAIATVLFLVSAVQARGGGCGGWGHDPHYNGWNNQYGCTNQPGYYYQQYGCDQGMNTVPYYNNMVPYDNVPYNNTVPYYNDFGQIMSLITPFLQGSPGY
jgi:hypothetical protein